MWHGIGIWVAVVSAVYLALVAAILIAWPRLHARIERNAAIERRLSDSIEPPL
jgi:hypothetical protein